MMSTYRLTAVLVDCGVAGFFERKSSERCAERDADGVVSVLWRLAGVGVLAGAFGVALV